jgi:hypothetical protein
VTATDDRLQGQDEPPGERPAEPGFDSRFPAALRQTSDTGFELLAPLTYRGNHQTFTVPEGQPTDLASVPATMRALFPPYGAYTSAAILHDYLWRVVAPNGRILYRDADGILRQAMRTLGVGTVRRWTMWAAVRWGALLTRKNGRRGWWADAPAVIAITLLALPWVALAAIGSLPGIVLLVITGQIGARRSAR